MSTAGLSKDVDGLSESRLPFKVRHLLVCREQVHFESEWRVDHLQLVSGRPENMYQRDRRLEKAAGTLRRG